MIWAYILSQKNHIFSFTGNKYVVSEQWLSLQIHKTAACLIDSHPFSRQKKRQKGGNSTATSSLQYFDATAYIPPLSPSAAIRQRRRRRRRRHQRDDYRTSRVTLVGWPTGTIRRTDSPVRRIDFSVRRIVFPIRRTVFQAKSGLAVLAVTFSCARRHTCTYCVMQLTIKTLHSHKRLLAPPYIYTRRARTRRTDTLRAEILSNRPAISMSPISDKTPRRETRRGVQYYMFTSSELL